MSEPEPEVLTPPPESGPEDDPAEADDAEPQRLRWHVDTNAPPGWTPGTG